MLCDRLVYHRALPLLCGLLAVAPGLAQPPPTTAPTTAPADRAPVSATVLEVQGDVHYAPLESTDWKPAQVGDAYPPETQIRTGIRSSIKLQIGDEEPYTALVVESAAKVVLSEAYKTSDTKRVRVGVGYGRVRAGVAEGGLKSQFTIDSPVATLSKRGTWNFGLFYERATDRFEVFLLDRGLVDVLNEITGQHRGLLPREAVTQAMRRWADEAQVRRNVPIPDLLGYGDLEVAFNRLRTDGLGVLDASGGRAVLIDLSNDLARQEFARLAEQQVPLLNLGAVRPEVRTRPEGFFGTGRGDELIRVMVESDSPLAKEGFARPGQYTFRRGAVEGWLREHKGKP